MSKKFEDAKLNMQNAEAAVDIYNNPAVKAVKSLLDKIPVIGALIDETTGYALQRFQDKKREEFIDVILSNSEMITSDKVNDVEFLINFAKTVEAVDRLATNDKVKYFANLLKNGYLKDKKLLVDEYDEYMNALSNLSYRQIEILIELYQFEIEISPLIIENKTVEHWGIFKAKMQKKYSLTESEFTGLLTNASKTGFNKQTNSAYFDSSENCYFINMDYMSHFIELIEEKTNE